MTTIGLFTANKEGGYVGAIRTVSLNVQVKFVPAEKSKATAPDFRVLAGAFELGAAWKKTSKAQRPYLSVTLDDPTFAAPIYARLLQSERGDFQLVWSRERSE